MADALGGEAYRIHVWIRQISPMIWRRLLVGSDSSIADLHHTLYHAQTLQQNPSLMLTNSCRKQVLKNHRA
jgi:hypothetical protein